MPVDPTQSVEVEEEITPDQEFESAFDLDESSEPEKKEEAPSNEEDPTSVPTDSEDTETEEETSKKEEDPEKSEDNEEGKELSALEIAERAAEERMKAAQDKKETSEDGDGSDKKVEDKDEEPPVEIDFTDVDTDPRAYAKKLVDSIEDKDRKEALNNLQDTYPEIFDGIVLIARDLVSRQKVKVADGVNLDIGGDLENFKGELTELKEFRTNFQREQAERAFFDAVEMEVPGARVLSKSDDFNNWLDSPKQSIGIRMLSESSDPKDAVLVLKAYNEYKTRLTAKEIDSKARDKKEGIDASLKGVSGGSRSDKVFDSSLDDFEAGFNGS